MSKPIAEILIHNATEVGAMLREKHNISVIGEAMYEILVKMAQHGAGVEEVLMKLPVEILAEPREFAERTHSEGKYRKIIAENTARMLGKTQNMSGEIDANGYAKTTGKPQNKSDVSEKPDNTILDFDINTIGYALLVNPKEPSIEEKIEAVQAGHSAFEVMQDIHAKDGVYLCYDKTIVAVLHTPHGIFVGTNGIKKQPSQHMCPRKGQSINQGYDKCVEQCQQPSHAELAALLKYKARVHEPDFENSWMEVYGAKEVCYHCKTTLELVGIQRITLKPLNQLGEIHGYQ